MTRRSRLIAIILALLLLPPLVLLLQFGAFLNRTVNPPAPVDLLIPSGASFYQTARDLEHTGVVSSALQMRLLARLRGESHNIKAGNYRFADPATPGEILARLVAGDVQRLRLTIPEGLTMQQVAARVEESGFGNAEQFLALCRDREFLDDLGLKVSSLEGYLFPETYTLDEGTPLKKLIRVMVAETEQRLTSELLAAGKEHGLDRHQLLTLASIVQKEAGNFEEMPLIAAVFHNRLRRRIPLQADPTVIYGIEDFDGNLTRRHLETKTPYNTYRFAGLPPGPIANPGSEAIAAAAFPAQVDYLYFVATGDGKHFFSRTLREHNQAVRRYQLKR